ncbi:MAG: hypothetical protein U5O16_40230 [Rhodococcus sp. (in: high G+C Gram-positive bacteria)]|nr:hypothetical protein [Rhodococcus sp. (in: high G+C Gram-positive bacteria)]
MCAKPVSGAALLAPASDVTCAAIATPWSLASTVPVRRRPAYAVSMKV